MPIVTPQTISTVQQKVDAACADQETGIPGAVVVVINKDGKEQIAHASGSRGHGSSEPMTLDNVFWIASCTKMIVGIACMQLVEKGVLSLDDSNLVEKLSPELKEVEVLQDDGKLAEKKRSITLRMLLTHTSGFGYSAFNEKLRDYGRPIGYDEFSGHIRDMRQPLIRQPGEGWEYGIGIDWAGVLIERATGLFLSDYLQRNIFEPLGLRNTSMFPTASMKSNLAYMNQRAPDGKLSQRDHLLRRPLIVESPEDVKVVSTVEVEDVFLSLKNTAVKIFAILLNNGTSPTNGKKFLEKETVDEMFKNQIPEFNNIGTRGFPASKAEITNPIPNLYPSSTPQGWGLTFMVSGGATGRSPGTVHWAGLPNLWWWCGRENGVAGIVCTQILPFADAKVLKLWMDVETAVYQGLVGDVHL